MSPAPASSVRACARCGLVQRLPSLVRGQSARCPRCRAAIANAAGPRSASRVRALATAALIIFPVAMLLPVLEVERLGHRHAATIWTGVVEMFRDGQVVIGLIVFVCSIVVPLLKLVGMICLTTPADAFAARHRALVYRAIDWLGRWGMVDVLLVAILIAAVKLGDWINVHPGPGVAAFASVVILSLLASACFDPHSIWQSPQRVFT